MVERKFEQPIKIEEMLKAQAAAEYAKDCGNFWQNEAYQLPRSPLFRQNQRFGDQLSPEVRRAVDDTTNDMFWI
jgi:hypothetical protein